MYTTIIVPIDGSETGMRALGTASHIATRCGAQLHLVMVHDPSMFIPFVPGEVAVPVYNADAVSDQRQEAERIVNDTVAQLRAQGVNAIGRVLEGTVVEAIADYASDVRANLTVMTTHGRSGFNRVRLGSVAGSYVTRTSTPTLLVRIVENGVAADSDLFGGTLICTLDGSPFAEQIVPHAIDLAAALDMHMELLSISQPASVPMAPFGTEALLADPRDLSAQEHNREDYLRRIAQRCPEGTSVRVVTDSSTATAIIEVAKEPRVGAIALATHGRGGLMRLVLGSVADEVLRGAHVPILVYKPESK